MAGAAALVVITFLLATTPPAYAGKSQRVRFQKGRTTAILKGRLPKDDYDYDAYIIRAKARQQLTVHLASPDAKARLVVYAADLGPTEDMITPEGQDPLRDWSGPLPVSGDYSIQVYTGGEGGSYTLEVTIR